MSGPPPVVSESISLNDARAGLQQTVDVIHAAKEVLQDIPLGSCSKEVLQVFGILSRISLEAISDPIPF